MELTKLLQYRFTQFDPFEDTESSPAATLTLTAVLVSPNSIRLRILKADLTDGGLTTLHSFTQFDPFEDTESGSS